MENQSENNQSGPGNPGNPGDSSEIFRNGHTFEMAGQFPEARKAYQMGLAISPEHHSWHYRMGCVLMKLDQPREAELSFRKAVELSPGNEAYLTNIGVSQDRQGHRDGAIRSYRRAIHQGGKSPVAYHNLGAIYAEEGRVAEAISAFESAIALEPDSEGYHNLGLVHFAGNDYVPALNCFERAVFHDPQFAIGHYFAGLCLMKSGLYKDACVRFDQAHDLNENLQRVSFHVGVCLHKLEKYTLARQKLEQALEFFPEDGRIHYQLALTCDALGLPQEARLHYSHARATRDPGPAF